MAFVPDYGSKTAREASFRSGEMARMMLTDTLSRLGQIPKDIYEAKEKDRLAKEEQARYEEQQRRAELQDRIALEQLDLQKGKVISDIEKATKEEARSKAISNALATGTVESTKLKLIDDITKPYEVPETIAKPVSLTKRSIGDVEPSKNYLAPSATTVGYKKKEVEEKVPEKINVDVDLVGRGLIGDRWNEYGKDEATRALIKSYGLYEAVLNRAELDPTLPEVKSLMDRKDEILEIINNRLQLDKSDRQFSETMRNAGRSADRQAKQTASDADVKFFGESVEPVTNAVNMASYYFDKVKDIREVFGKAKDEDFTTGEKALSLIGKSKMGETLAKLGVGDDKFRSIVSASQGNKAQIFKSLVAEMGRSMSDKDLAYALELSLDPTSSPKIQRDNANQVILNLENKINGLKKRAEMGGYTQSSSEIAGLEGSISSLKDRFKDIYGESTTTPLTMRSDPIPSSIAKSSISGNQEEKGSGAQKAGTTVNAKTYWDIIKGGKK
jgi:hypothetical protein